MRSDTIERGYYKRDDGTIVLVRQVLKPRALAHGGTRRRRVRYAVVAYGKKATPSANAAREGTTVETDLVHFASGVRNRVERRCRVKGCGCTDARACDDGCSWAREVGPGWNVCTNDDAQHATTLDALLLAGRVQGHEAAGAPSQYRRPKA